jgi:hypothetical protein
MPAISCDGVFRLFSAMKNSNNNTNLLKLRRNKPQQYGVSLLAKVDLQLASTSCTIGPGAVPMQSAGELSQYIYIIGSFCTLHKWASGPFCHAQVRSICPFSSIN